MILFQSEILPPNSGEDQKIGCSPHSGSISMRNFEFFDYTLIFLSTKWAVLVKKPWVPDIFRPFECQTRGAPLPAPPPESGFFGKLTL